MTDTQIDILLCSASALMIVMAVVAILNDLTWLAVGCACGVLVVALTLAKLGGGDESTD